MVNYQSVVAPQQCDECAVGTFKEGANVHAECIPHLISECGPGEKLANKGSTTTPQQCVACEPGTFKSGTVLFPL
jgi:hypothetical protein